MWLCAVVLLAQPEAFETGRLLDEAAKMQGAPARKLLAQVVRTVRTAKDLPAREREEAVRRLCKLLPRQAATMEEALEVFGPDAQKSVARQILFRKYLEQWTFAPPLALTVSFDCPLGQEPRLRGATVVKP
jgi:hypothetical protein